MSPMQKGASYFSPSFGIPNYTLANEDTSLEHALLPLHCASVLTIAGSGSRVLPLVARAPSRITCVDLSSSQLALTELRLALAREASYEDFLGVLGYPPVEDSRSLRRHWIERLELRPASREFLKGWLGSNDWRAPIHLGRWERTFSRLSGLVRAMTGGAARGIFECRTLPEQLDYLERHFPWRRWGAAIALLGNASVFNALLYRGSFPVGNIPGSRRQFYGERYRRILELAPARENFFLQLTFLGKLLHAEGNPIECRRDVFSAAKQALERTEVRFEAGDAVEAASKEQGGLGFLSFSDVPSYFGAPLEQEFLQRIRPGLAPGALVVVRNYLRIPERCDSSGYERRTQEHRGLIDREGVGVYDVDVWRHA